MNEYPTNQTKENEQIDYSYINLECCCFNMRKVSRAVTQYFDRYLEPAGIRATQFTLLVALLNTTSKTLTEIAENLVMDRTTLTRNLKPLEKLELISIAKSYDKRAKSYKLTDNGKSVVEKALPFWKEAQSGIINSLTEERYHAMVEELKKLLSITSALKAK